MTNLASPATVNTDIGGNIDANVESELERYRVELTRYCYRMLGSAFEADDAVQETMVRAWRAFERFEGRSTVRSWLYRIATNVCLDALNGRGKRAIPMDLGPASSGEGVPGSPPPEVLWLGPLPDSRATAPGIDPGDVAVHRDTIRLAFVAALQLLPPRQRAILILRDVLGWQATEVGELLDMTGTSVHSALQRARATLASRDLDADAPLDPVDDGQRRLLARYVEAFERFDVAALVALLHEDAVLSMPPHDLWLQGAVAIDRWWHGGGMGCRTLRLVPTSANGSPAFGMYKPGADGSYEPFGIQVVEISGGRISALHSFLEPSLLPRFGLPARLAE